MNDVVLDAFNHQIKMELSSGYLYLSMSAHFDHQNLPGFAHWMRLQAQEELEHAMRLFDYVLRRGGRVELDGIDAPATDFGAPLALFESVLEHERAVTGMIHGLFELSGKRWGREKRRLPAEFRCSSLMIRKRDCQNSCGRSVTPRSRDAGFPGR